MFAPRCLFLLALTPLLGGCVFANIDLSQGRKPYTESTLRSGSGKKIAIIDIAGTITDSQPSRPLFGEAPESMMKRVLDQLRKARADDDVAAVVLKIDSPGGGVTASDIIYREVVALREKGGKKVVAALMDTAASGGYYIAVGADRIIAHPTTITGSIGVIMQTFNLKGLMKKVGVEVEPVKSAAKKDIGSPFRPMSEDEKKVLQDIIDEMYGTFLAKVRKGRPNVSEATIKEMCDGRVFTGRVAKQRGFVDQIGYLDEALNLASKLAGESDPEVIRYHRESEAPAGLYARSGPSPQTPLVNIDLASFLEPLRPGFYYYWMPGHRGMSSR